VRLLLTGAAGVVGTPLAERGEAAGLDVVRAGRRQRGTGWLAWDMSRAAYPGAAVDGVVHAAPLWLLPDHLERLAAAGANRVVCYGSTSALTKQDSASPAERALAHSLSDAEKRIEEASQRLGLATTLFRPAMIYGYGRDANVSAIARFVRRWGFFPVAGPGSGRRQPVHADDLADAALAVLESQRTAGRSYNLGGGETLSYRAMVARIFQALGRRRRIITLPVAPYRALLSLAGRFNRSVSGAMADRMNRDLVFDSSAAREDFGFAPQPFLRHPERDLPAP